MEDLSAADAAPLAAQQQAGIVTIDGPAGAGKSSIAQQLAGRLGFELLDTGAMYRAVTLAALRDQLDYHDVKTMAEVARRSRIELPSGRTLLDGEDVSEAIRANSVTQATRYAADNVAVRQLLVDRQRAIAAGRWMVCEGRDQGSVVFPASPCKIFLTATPEERARRRQLQLEGQQEFVSYEELLQQIQERDARDSTREIGPLIKMPDSVEVLTDGQTIEQVLERLESIVRDRIEIRAKSGSEA